MRRQIAPTNAAPTPRLDECPHCDAQLRSAARHCHPPMPARSLCRDWNDSVVYGGNRAGLSRLNITASGCASPSGAPELRSRASSDARDYQQKCPEHDEKPNDCTSDQQDVEFHHPNPHLGQGTRNCRRGALGRASQRLPACPSVAPRTPEERILPKVIFCERS
jgi:hypothetical protein